MRVKTDRTNRILEILTDSGRTEVSVLSKLLGVSEVTVRKDLDELEERRLVKRERGYALLNSEDDLNTRIAYHYEQKKRIAELAAREVSDGETIMIESGSCCALLAEALTRIRRNLTIITNSAYIAEHLRGVPDYQIILLGGVYQQNSQVMVGPMVAECAGNFFVRQFFAGADGYSARIGFTNRDQLRAQAVRDMAKQAEAVTVLTESQKFLNQGAIPLNLKDRLCRVITDSGIPEKDRRALNAAGVEVITPED